MDSRLRWMEFLKMQNQKISKLYIFILIFFTLLQNAFADASLSLERVLESARKNFPTILEQKEKIQESKGALAESRGSFDLKLKSDFSGDLSGYYDGLHTKTYLETQLPTIGNIELFSGYRKSFGTFPVYDGQFQTLGNGEVFGGARVDLLRGFGLDETRLQMSIASQKLEIEKNKLVKQILKSQEEAAKAYWEWVANGFVFKTLEELYQISLDRDLAIQKRVKRGDLPEIAWVENQQNILQRKSDLQNAHQAFVNAAQQLSIYYRDDRGVTLLPMENELPSKFLTDIAYQNQSDLNDLISKQPDVVQIDFERKIVEDQISFSRSLVYPKLNTEAQFKKDLGEGSVTLGGNQTQVMMNFEFPFQNRKAQGKLDKFKALNSVLNFQQNLLKDQIKVRYKQNLEILNTTREILANLEQEIKLAKRLQEAEVQKWQSGDSDFFLINLREQTMARSKIQWIKAGLILQKAFAEYQNISLLYLM